MPAITIMKNEPGDPPTHPDDAKELSPAPVGVFAMPGDSDVTAVLLMGGMQSGKSSVSWRVEQGDSVFWFETSLECLVAATHALMAMDGGPIVEEPGG